MTDPKVHAYRVVTRYQSCQDRWARSRPQAPRATQLLTAAEIPFTVHRYDHDPAAVSYGWEAVKSLGVEPERVFKTLLVAVEDRMIVAVVPVNHLLDLKAIAAVVGGKRAVMVEPADAERVTGYVVGGISPLGQRRKLTTVVDVTAERYETIYVSAGKRGAEIELRPNDLVAACGAIVAGIAGGADRHR